MPNVWIDRDGSNVVTGIFKNEQYPGQEKIDDSHQDVLDYINTYHTIPQQQQAQRKQDINDNLPTWAQVNTAVSNITNLDEAKTFILKLSRVVYWLAKNSQD